MPLILKKSSINPKIFEVWDDQILLEEIEITFPLKEKIPAFNGIRELKKWLQEKEYKRAKNMALFSLAQRDYLTEELKQKLKSKGFSQKVIEELFQSLSEMKLLNDGHLLDRRIEKLLVKGKGPHYIAAKLGISFEEVSSRISLEQEQKSRAKFLEKHKNKPTNKLKALLFRHGFNPDTTSLN